MLTYSPANRNSILEIAAVKIAAIVTLFANADINRPIPTDVYDISIKIRKSLPNSLKSMNQYVINSYRRGVRAAPGESMMFLARK